jgi:hypothetical protein
MNVMLRAIVIGIFVFIVGCATVSDPLPESGQQDQNPDRLLVVDCLLPGQIRKLGQNMSFIAPRRAVKTSGVDCEIRGGEYVAYDRANYATALKIWLPQAKLGDAAAQTYVGEIYEKGLGVTADYALARHWYSQAAEQGYSRAQINLGYLYEGGLGVPRDLVAAMNWYRKASGLSDAELEYVSTIEVAKREARQQENVQLKQEVQTLRAELEKNKRTLRVRKSGLAKAEGELLALRQELESRKTISILPPVPISAGGAEPTAAGTEQDLERRLQEARQEQQRLVAKLADQQLKVAEQQTRISSLEAEKQGQSLTEKVELEQALERRNQEIASLQQRLEQEQERVQAMQSLEGQMTDLQQERQQLTAQLKQQQLQTRTLRSDLDQARGQLNQRRDELNSTKTALNQTQEALVQAKAVTQSQQDLSLIQNLESKQTDLQAMIKTQQQEMAWLEGEMKQQQEALRNELKVAQDNEQQLRQVLQSRDQEISSLQVQLASAEQQLHKNTQEQGQFKSLEKELQRREAEVQRQRNEIAQLQSELSQQTSQLQESDSSAVVAANAVGPSIELIDPPLSVTRGVPSINLRAAISEVDIIGRVSPDKQLYSFRVNDQDQVVENGGLFRARMPVSAPSTSVSLVAIDKQGQRAAVDFLIVPKSKQVKVNPEKGLAKPTATSSSGREVNFGSYYALIIGNNRYKNLTNLSTAVNDARAVEAILKSKYGFKTRLLLDADRYTMLSALNEMREKLTEKDNLLIYYAGHGELDNVNLRGYWLPVDAEVDSSTNWISNVAVTDILNVMSAKHVLVVADSCYSGAMTRSSLARLDSGMSEQKRQRWFKVMAKTRARAVLTSGGVKPVLDSGGGDHSIFAQAFLDVLNENKNILESFSLYREVQKRVKHLAATLRIDQDPQYAPIKYAGHEAGEFLFLPSQAQIGMGFHDNISISQVNRVSYARKYPLSSDESG